MKAARILVLGVALAAGGAAAFLVGSDDEKKPEAPPAPVVQQLPTVDVLIAKGDIGMGTAVAAENFAWQAWPEATTGDSYVTRKSRPNAIEELRRRDHARAVHRGRADPRSQADQGQRRRRLHGRDPAVRHARGLDRDLAGNRRGRFHSAERPRRRDPVAARSRTTGAATHRRPAKPFSPMSAFSQSTRPSRKRTASASSSARPRRIELTPRQAETLAQSRQLGSLSLALRSLLDASKPEEERDDRGKGEINTVRYGVSANR